MAIIPVVPAGQPVNNGSALSGLTNLAIGAGAGVALDQGAQYVASAARNTKIGLVGSLFTVGLGLLTSNSAIGPANLAMQAANAVAEAPGAFATADITNLKHSCQQSAAALQQLTWGGWTGVSNLTPPTSSPSTPIAPPQSNIGTAIVIGGIVLAAVYWLT